MLVCMRRLEADIEQLKTMIRSGDEGREIKEQANVEAWVRRDVVDDQLAVNKELLRLAVRVDDDLASQFRTPRNGCALPQSDAYIPFRLRYD